mmetsp:Transcript_30850/g.63928  ORF Transcript_30850/g.63928 Transcript_30850/m.63928 type:complete len:117 (+) Transcript_30850:515-865(+)
MDDLLKLRPDFKAKAKELQFCSGKQWMWSVHKCVGMTGPMVTDLNLYKDFVVWLEGKGRKEDVKLLQALGPQVGDRFWALFHNAEGPFKLHQQIRVMAETRCCSAWQFGAFGPMLG